MFLSEWHEFSLAPCLAGKETWWHLASRFCWNRGRPWLLSELVSFLVGLRTCQHSGSHTWTIWTPPSKTQPSFSYCLLQTQIGLKVLHGLFCGYYTLVTKCFFNNKVPKLFFCVDYNFTIYTPIANGKENNFSREFVRGTCRINPCNDINKLRHSKVSRVMNIRKLILCSELLCICWLQFLATLHLCRYISQSFYAEFALLLDVTRCLNYQGDIFDASYTNSQACWIQSCQLSVGHTAISVILLATLK